jgi:hypothetical protein
MRIPLLVKETDGGHVPRLNVEKMTHWGGGKMNPTLDLLLAQAVLPPVSSLKNQEKPEVI